MSSINHPAVSIVIPCYNYGHFLSETLESVLAQTWQSWECIVVDDGSVDNTEQIASLFTKRDSRIQYILQPNLGVSAARNKGIATSKGKYIQLLDADDKLENRKLETQVKLLEQHPMMDIVYGATRYFQEDALILSADIAKRMAFPGVSGIGREVLIFLIRRNIMVVNAPLVRISVFKDVGLFNQALVGNEDWEFWIRCAFAGKFFQYADEEKTCALVRAHPQSATQNILAMLSTSLKIRQWLQTLPLPTNFLRLNNYGISLQLAKIAKFKFSKREYALGFSHAAQALRILRFDARIVAVFIFLLLPERFASRLVLIVDRLRNSLMSGKKH